MAAIRIYRNPGCAKCARYARMHHRLDWLRRVETSTDTPPRAGALHGVPLRMGEVVVEDLATGVVHEGAEAFWQMCTHIPAYRLLRGLLRIPAFRNAVVKELAGDCSGDACAV